MKKLWASKAKCKEKLLEEQQGMMVVEAVLTFTVFVMVVIAIVYLITIFTLHNKIQGAINATAHEIAGYTYLYQVLGVRAAEQTLDKDGQAYTQPIDDTAAQVVDSINKMQGLYTDVENTQNTIQNLEISQQSFENVYQQAERTINDASDTVESVEKSVQDVTNLFSDPDSLLTGMIYMGASAGRYAVKGAAAQTAAGLLTQKYLEDNMRDADAYLRAYGVKDGYKGLSFSGSTMFCDPDMRLIDIVVQYDVDLKFIGFVMPEDTLHVVQRVTVPAWLDGDGKTYSP